MGQSTDRTNDNGGDDPSDGPWMEYGIRNNSNGAEDHVSNLSRFEGPDIATELPVAHSDASPGKGGEPHGQKEYEKSD